MVLTFDNAALQHTSNRLTEKPGTYGCDYGYNLLHACNRLPGY